MFCPSKGVVQLLAITSLFLIAACSNNTRKVSENSFRTAEELVIDTLPVSSDHGNFEQIAGNASTTSFVILHEDDNTMFAEINQIIDAFGKYFIVDTYGSRKVVSFDHNGKPFASYGKRGNGPGEYIFPWDVDVNADYVYILDRSRSKLLTYNHKGNYMGSRDVPFESKGFTLLKDNKILFNLESSEGDNYQLCVTDSALNPLKYMLHYPDGYVGGWVTDAVFQKNEKGITYYCSPADTIYRLDYNGNLTGKRLLDFQNGSIHASAKIDFITAEEQGKLTSGMHLLNNPVELPNGICFMEVTDYSNPGAYVVVSDPASGKHRATKFASNMSIYDVITPCTSNKNNQIISFLDRELAGKCVNFGMMPDSLVKALDEGNRLLVIRTVH